jgi:crotonobetainyl-CoA:carnitine CoA-transferase CaiB-like acyl-CoA transferase
MEAAATVDEYSAAMYAFMGAIRRRYYSRHLFSFPSDIYRCKDGYVVVSPAANGFPSPTAVDQGASPMSLLLGDVELDQHDLFKDRWARWFRWQEFEGLIKPYLSANTAEEIVEFAQALRMPFAYVFDAACFWRTSTSRARLLPGGRPSGSRQAQVHRRHLQGRLHDGAAPARPFARRA